MHCWVQRQALYKYLGIATAVLILHYRGSMRKSFESKAGKESWPGVPSCTLSKYRKCYASQMKEVFRKETLLWSIFSHHDFGSLTSFYLNCILSPSCKIQLGVSPVLFRNMVDISNFGSGSGNINKMSALKLWDPRSGKTATSVSKTYVGEFSQSLYPYVPWFEGQIWYIYIIYIYICIKYIYIYIYICMFYVHI